MCVCVYQDAMFVYAEMKSALQELWHIFLIGVWHSSSKPIYSSLSVSKTNAFLKGTSELPNARTRPKPTKQELKNSRTQGKKCSTSWLSRWKCSTATSKTKSVTNDQKVKHKELV